MSIFKVKHWWSNSKHGKDYVIGIQSSSCIKVDKFTSHSDSDCIIVGEDNVLTIYKPLQNEDTVDNSASSVLLEVKLNDSILQVDTGKFTGLKQIPYYHFMRLKMFQNVNPPLLDIALEDLPIHTVSEDRQILLLHSQSYAVYQLERKPGNYEAGDQNILHSVIKHSFKRKAYSAVSGHFGNIQSRDLICIQGIDGSISIFDQDTFLFICVFDDVIIPSPIAYIANSDCFVLCKSTWVMEIYSYQQLREISEISSRQNKKTIPQWVYNAGEEVTAIQIIKTSSNFSSVVALGERHLYCFQDNGLMKYMIKFDFTPVSFSAYLIGWYYEPTARLLIMVASDDAKLYIYEGTTMLWSCQLPHTTICLARCFVRYLPGGVVTLSIDGVVTVSYIGTEPDLNVNSMQMINDVADPEEVHNELNLVEESLKKLLDSKDTDHTFGSIQDTLKIKADFGKPVHNTAQEFKTENHSELHLFTCPLIIMLTCDDPKKIVGIQITYVCTTPISCNDNVICLENINGTEIVENQIFISDEADMSNATVKVMFTVTQDSGRIRVLSRDVLLPLNTYCTLTDIVAENEVKLTISLNKSTIDLCDILTDYSKEDVVKFQTHNEISLSYINSKKKVTIRSLDQQYILQTNDFPEIIAILENITSNLKEYFSKMQQKDFKCIVKYDQVFSKQLTHRFLKIIEIHAKERIKLKSFEDELEILQKQFTLVQKKLLIQYGALPPGDCDPLEFLMKDTYERIIKTVYDVIESKATLSRIGCTLVAVGRLIMFILKQTTTDHLKLKLIEEMFSLNSIHEGYYEWEESVIQALSYVVNNIFQKSEKDKEKLAPVTEQGILSHVNLKRFLKQIKLVLDKMFSEVKYDGQEKIEPIKMIEEIVEVL